MTRIARYALAAAGLVVLGMAAVTARLKSHEDDIVFVVGHSREHLLASLPPESQPVSVPVPGRTAIAGLVFPAAKDADTAYWVLQLHGNGDSAFSAGQVRHCEALSNGGYNVLEIDYHGFGRSPGDASESAMYEDSEAAYQSLLLRGVPDSHIILLGHSLGSGPAVVLATHHPAAALVLFGAFTSMPEAVQDRYPYVPIRRFIGPQFNSLSRMRDVHIPVLIAHSRTDKVIYYANALKLYAAANAPKHLTTFDDKNIDDFGGHVDALYAHVDVMRAALSTLVPGMTPP